ncbi:DNA repair protein RecO [Patescibacteria group bacterium]
MSRSFNSEGIVLKRINYGDADRIVTFYTKKFGKITAIAKGSRKLSSRKKGGMEPGTESKCLYIRSKGMPIVTQSQVLSSFSKAQEDLTSVTQVFQVLEIIDLLTVDEEPNINTYNLLKNSLNLMQHNGSKKEKLIENIKKILESLGFGPPENFNELDIKHYIEDLASKKLKTKKFLTTKTS